MAYPDKDQFSVIFNGVDQYGIVNPAPNTSVSNNFTFEVWCSPDDTIVLHDEFSTTGQRFLIHPFSLPAGSDFANSADFGLSVGINGIRIYEYRQIANVIHLPALLTKNVEVSNQKFSHIAVTVNQKQPNVYLDGNLVQTGTKSNSKTLYTQTKRIAGGQFGFYSGAIAQIKLHRKILSNTEILTSYLSTKNFLENYSLTPNINYDNEETLANATVSFQLDTTKVKDGTLLYWNNIGSSSNSDFSDNLDSGTVTVTSNTGVITRVLNSDASIGKTIIIEIVDPVTQNVVVTSSSFGLKKSTRRLLLWGAGGSGQLGTGSWPDYYTPTDTVYLVEDWKTVSCGSGHTAAIRNDGSLWLWGSNDSGQIGDGTFGSPIYIPKNIMSNASWSQVSCGGRGIFGAGSHTAAIKTDGSLWLWGLNNWGQLGDSTTTTRLTPVQTTPGGNNWKQLSCGEWTTAAIKTDGTLWLWGYNAYYQLGDNTSISKSYPVQTSAGGNNWKEVSVGFLHVAAVKTDGTLWTWGFNYNGQLGDGTTTLRGTPTQIVSAGNNWKQVSCGFYHTAAIKNDGTLWVWGNNQYGQVGDGTTTTRTSPVQITSSGNNWKQVSCGGFNTAAIRNDGTLWVWGAGPLGIGNSNSSLTPIQTIAGGNDWKFVSAGRSYAAGIKANYSAYYINPNPVTLQTVNEGQTVTYNVNVFGYEDGTFYWTNSGTTDASDFVDSSNQGTITTNNGFGTITRIIKSDAITEGGTETIVLKLRKDSFTGQLIANALSVTVNDTSLDPTYSITPNTYSILEAQTVVYTVTTTDVENGTVLYWTNSGTTDQNDFTDFTNQGTVTINSNLGTITRTLRNESPIEGIQTIVINLRKDSHSGNIVALASVVTVNDTPSYQITPNTSSVFEGNTVQYTVSTNFVPNGTVVYWTNSGTTTANDFSDNVNSGSVTINSGTATFTRTLIDDLLIEDTETIVINLRTNSIEGNIVANSSTVVIPGNFCDPYQINVFPFLTYFPYDADGNYYNEYFYDDPAANGVSLNINLGGFSSSWENDGTGQPWERVITSFIDPYGTLYVDGGVIFDYPPDPPYLSMAETYSFQIVNNKSLYVAVGGDSDGYVTAPVGHTVYPGVATLNTYDSYLQPRNYGEPIIFELWYSLNPNRSDLTKGYGNYTFFGQGGYVMPEIWIDYNTNPYGSTRKVKKYQGGILKVDADMNNLQESDFVYGVSFVDTGSGGTMKIIREGIVIHSYNLGSTNRMSSYINCYYYDEVSLMANNKSFGDYIEIGSSGNYYIWYDAGDNGYTSNTHNYFDTYLVKWGWIVDAESSGNPLDDSFYCDRAHIQMYTIPNVDLSCDPGAFPTYDPPVPLPGLPAPPPDPTCTNGLILNLDAANVSSYPGSGTTWFDLSCLDYDGELIGGPTFDGSDGGGCLVFDAANEDFVKIVLPADRTIKSFTFNVWLKRITGGYSWSWKTIIDCGDDNLFFGLDIDGNPVMYNPYYETVNPLSMDTWYNLTVTHDYLEPIYFYVNGSLIHTTTNNNTVLKASYFNIGAGFNGSYSNEHFMGKIATVQIYDKKLTSAEVLSYFNSTKSRFGIT